MPHELTDFFNKLNAIDDAEFMVISGSVPPGVSPNIYYQIINAMRKKGVKVSLDADGDAMKNGIKAAPYMIKPNRHEFKRLVGVEANGHDEIAHHAKSLGECAYFDIHFTV